MRGSIVSIEANSLSQRSWGAGRRIELAKLHRLARGEGVVFVFLEGSRDKISDRLASRHGHFMPPALLESQFDALEAPTADENFISLSVSATPAEEAQEIITRLNLDAADARP